MYVPKGKNLLVQKRPGGKRPSWYITISMIVIARRISILRFLLLLPILVLYLFELLSLEFCLSVLYFKNLLVGHKALQLFNVLFVEVCSLNCFLHKSLYVSLGLLLCNLLAVLRLHHAQKLPMGSWAVFVSTQSANEKCKYPSKSQGRLPVFPFSTPTILEHGSPWTCVNSDHPRDYD